MKQGRGAPEQLRLTRSLSKMSQAEQLVLLKIMRSTWLLPAVFNPEWQLGETGKDRQGKENKWFVFLVHYTIKAVEGIMDILMPMSAHVLELLHLELPHSLNLMLR